MLLNSTLAKPLCSYLLVWAKLNERAGAFDTTGGGENLEREHHVGCYQYLTQLENMSWLRSFSMGGCCREQSFPPCYPSIPKLNSIYFHCVHPA